MKHLLWVVPVLLAVYAGLYLAATSVETVNLLVKKHVTRVYDKDFEAWAFWPLAKLEGWLRSPDEFVFRERVLGL